MIDTGQMAEGRVYRFSYDGKRRIALVEREDSDPLTCWDFTSEGYRSFSEDKITDVTDVTDKVRISNTKIDFNNPNIRSKYFANAFYYVNF